MFYYFSFFFIIFYEFFSEYSHGKGRAVWTSKICILIKMKVFIMHNWLCVCQSESEERERETHVVGESRCYCNLCFFSPRKSAVPELVTIQTLGPLPALLTACFLQGWHVHVLSPSLSSSGTQAAPVRSCQFASRTYTPWRLTLCWPCLRHRVSVSSPTPDLSSMYFFGLDYKF